MSPVLVTAIPMFTPMTAVLLCWWVTRIEPDVNLKRRSHESTEICTCGTLDGSVAA